MIESPTAQLRQEHELVLVVVEAMEREAADVERTGRVRVERVEQMVDFTRSFTDGCHHHKEEEALFPALKEHSAAAAGPVSVMLSEHEAGRAAIGEIVEVLSMAEVDAAARETVARNLALYAELLRLHIDKENSVLFPLAERTLNDQEQALLAEEFERIEVEETGAGAHERYHALAQELATPPEA